MKDLSELAADSMWISSQEAGNQQADNSGAMTAPGSEPVDVLVNRDVHNDPHVDTTPDPHVNRHLDRGD